HPTHIPSLFSAIFPPCLCLGRTSHMRSDDLLRSSSAAAQLDCKCSGVVASSKAMKSGVSAYLRLLIDSLYCSFRIRSNSQAGQKEAARPTRHMSGSEFGWKLAVAFQIDYCQSRCVVPSLRGLE